MDIKTLVTQHASVAVDGSALSVTGDEPRAYTTVQFGVPPAMRDLSTKRFIEIDIENTGDKPLRFSFWALSGNGWGGASTWSTRPEMSNPPAADAPKPLGCEVLAAKERRRFRIDMHACYPEPDVSRRFYTRAINPASIRWLKLVLGDMQTAPAAIVHSVSTSGTAPAEARESFQRIVVPDIERIEPAAGKRVYQKLPGWENTTLEHVITLPKEWQRGAKFPIIVEYTGNVFYDKWCHSSGFTDQGNMAYGLSRGETFILLNLPFISADGTREEPNGWGSIEKTEDYCLQALKLVNEKFGGDLGAVFFTGFSRGQLAMNYLALRDERIAPIWRGFIGSDPARPSAKLWPDGKGWNNCAIGWDKRASRLNGRPWIALHPHYGAVHVDVEYLEDSPSTVKTREWLYKLLAERARGGQ